MSCQASAAPAAPEVARRYFPPDGRLQAARRYAELLATAGVERGLLGPREVPRLWDRHLLNCGAVAELLPPHTRTVDVGSGAGLPGVVLALARPDLSVDLVEPLLRRTRFLTEVVDELGLGSRVRVIRGRAEERSVRDLVGSAPFVTARAVAPLDRLVRWCLPLLAPGGRVLALKGVSAETELAALPLPGSGVVTAKLVVCGRELTEPTRVVVLERGTQ